MYEGNEDRCKEKIISYFQSKQYIRALYRTIAQIENKPLVTIFKAVCCEDDANKMAQEIKDFLCDLKNFNCVDLGLNLNINHNIFEVRINDDFSKLREKNLNERSKEKTYLGRAVLLTGFIISMELIGRISSGQTMPLPLLCGFIVFGPLALLCCALLYEITSYLVRGAFFIFRVPILLIEMSKCVLRNGSM